jgi:hypothetical protein
MDGMIAELHALEALSRDEVNSASFTINLPSATAAIAEVSVSSVDYLYGPDKLTAYCAFTGCVTDGSTAPLPAVENFAPGSISGNSRQVVIRNGLKSISYEIDVQNCNAAFIVNVFFWPAVDRGNL